MTSMIMWGFQCKEMSYDYHGKNYQGMAFTDSSTLIYVYQDYPDQFQMDEKDSELIEEAIQCSMGRQPSITDNPVWQHQLKLIESNAPGFVSFDTSSVAGRQDFANLFSLLGTDPFSGLNECLYMIDNSVVQLSQRERGLYIEIELQFKDNDCALKMQRIMESQWKLAIQEGIQHFGTLINQLELTQSDFEELPYFSKVYDYFTLCVENITVVSYQDKATMRIPLRLDDFLTMFGFKQNE